MDRTTQRICLRCTKPFLSLGPENRVCRRCEKRVQEMGGTQVRVVLSPRVREVGFTLEGRRA